MGLLFERTSRRRGQGGSPRSGDGRSPGAAASFRGHPAFPHSNPPGTPERQFRRRSQGAGLKAHQSGTWRPEPLRSWREATCCPFSEGNAIPMSPLSCCQNVASQFVAMPYYIANSGLRKTGDLGFEPSSHAFHSHWGGIAMALQPRLFQRLRPQTRLLSHCSGIGVALPVLHPICTQNRHRDGSRSGDESRLSFRASRARRSCGR
jgi:hypothetical protein